ncbi:hypothetical protein OAS18_07430, partial [Nitrospinaceae bacterium]|nr:hypothetical protein [Nitrospinaceae bacterium]
DSSELTSWKSDRIKGFREKLKAEGIFPGCLGCCQSEYIGPTSPEGEAIRVREAAMACSRA